MLVLALDTTTRAGSVALVDDERIIEERAGDPLRTQAERLPGEVLTLLEAHSVALSSIDLFAVASGPGSFTGLRVGIATMQGFAYVTERRMIGIPVLDALGHVASVARPAGSLAGVWMDAHRHDVFAALYRITDAPLFQPDRLLALEPATVGVPAVLLNAWRPAIQQEKIVWIGDGATMFGDVIRRQYAAAVVLPHPVLAGAIGRLAVVAARRGAAISPAGFQPLYVRRPDAEIDRDKRMAATPEAAGGKDQSER
jgi:tRNA threonylcarbamoyladenosine biosynthesis protein TsaB